MASGQCCVRRVSSRDHPRLPYRWVSARLKQRGHRGPGRGRAGAGLASAVVPGPYLHWDVARVPFLQPRVCGTVGPKCPPLAAEVHAAPTARGPARPQLARGGPASAAGPERRAYKGPPVTAYPPAQVRVSDFPAAWSSCTGHGPMATP